MKFFKYDVAIIGGGCSGLMTATAIVKNNKKLKVVILEKNAKVGRKLLATGNGRGNLSNQHIAEPFYFGSCAKYVRSMWKVYDCNFIRRYFSDLGLFTVSDSEGRIYPLSNNVSSVLDCMRNYYRQFGNVDELCNTVVENIIIDNNVCLLECIGTDNEKIRISAKYAVISCGGKASPKLSTDGLGYTLLNQLKIRTSALYPSLVPIICNDKLLHFLKGVRMKGGVSLVIDGRIVAAEQGEIQFNEKSLSGICIFQLSGYINKCFAEGKKNGIKIILDILPQFSEKEVSDFISERIKQFGKYPLENLFDGLLHKKVALSLYRKCGIINLERTSADLSKKERDWLCTTLKKWEFIPTQASSFENAQITAGGILPDEIDFSHMRSKKYRNLYFCGEIMDIDGLCGGYNLHWAWCSAIIAANTITDSRGTVPVLSTLPLQPFKKA